MLHWAGQFHYQLIHRFIFSEEFCKVLFFDHRGRLQVLKVHDLKLSCRKFQDVWKSKFRGSFIVINCNFCSKAGPDI
jgi:hypothetical protein